MATDPLETPQIEGLTQRTRELTASANGFARAMTSAFSASVTGGKQFDQILQTLALRLSNMALRSALRPVEQILSSQITSLIGAVIPGGGAQPAQTAATADIARYAAGGVIGAPTYFPMPGGVALAGEAGPEAILPLARGADGRLGVASNGGASITVHIATPDADSFRRSESYVAGQIARAVARGRRAM